MYDDGPPESGHYYGDGPPEQGYFVDDGPAEAGHYVRRRSTGVRTLRAATVRLSRITTYGGGPPKPDYYVRRRSA